jgi:antitoxin VapB
MTQAVTVVIRERIARVQRQRHVGEIIARAQDIIRQAGGVAPYIDHAALLYDEHGLPQ